MASSRRPARFERRGSKQTKEITQDQLNLLRAAAARVYIDEQNPADRSSNPADKSSEVNRPEAGCANREKEAGSDDGVQLLAAAAAEIGAEGKNEETGCRETKNP